MQIQASEALKIEVPKAEEISGEEIIMGKVIMVANIIEEDDFV